MTRRTLLMLALTVVATIVPMATVQACSCMVPDAAQFLEERDFVFAGSLIELPNRGGGNVDGLGGLENVAYTFEVDVLESLKRVYYFTKRMARAALPSADIRPEKTDRA